MRVDHATYERMPPHLKAMFTKLPNPGSEEVLAGFPQAKGNSNKQLLSRSGGTKHAYAGYPGGRSDSGMGRNDTGSAARFFYCAKASKSERNGSKHPTVKPLALMRYLVRLVTPPGGTVLEPFAGGGTTLEAAHLEGFDAIGIEQSADYLPDIQERFARCQAEYARTALFENQLATTGAT